MPNKISEKEELAYLRKLDDAMKAKFPASQNPRVKRGWRGLEAVIDAPSTPLSRDGVAPFETPAETSGYAAIINSMSKRVR
jgi:hypothetical protein